MVVVVLVVVVLVTVALPVSLVTEVVVLELVTELSVLVSAGLQAVTLAAAMRASEASAKVRTCVIIRCLPLLTPWALVKADAIGTFTDFAGQGKSIAARRSTGWICPSASATGMPS